MTHVNKTPLDLTLHLVSVGGNSDGGWVPGDGYPNPQIGRVGQRYVDVQTGHIYGPKTRDGWPQDPTHTLNLGNIAGQFANILSRVPALEVRATNIESRVTTLEERAVTTSGLIIQQQNRTNDHELRIETLEADSDEIKRRIGMVDTSLSARMLAAEDSLNGLSHLHDVDLADFNSRVNTLQTSLNGNSSQITHLQESYTGFTQTWAQDVITLRSEFNGNLAIAQETLRTHADRFSATAQSISTLQVQVGDARGLITTESQTRADQYSALSTQISTLSAEFGGSIANISTQQTAMANEFEAYAGTVEHVTAELGSVRANITDQVEAMASATDAVARRVNTLEGATSDLSGRITTEEAARVNADSAVLTSAQSLIASAESGLQTRITQESAARLSGDQSEAYQRSLLDTKFTNQGQTLQAAITAESTARSNAIAAETSSRNQQISTVNTNIGKVSAAITSEAQTRANAIAAETSARNSQVSSLNTSIGNVSAAVTLEASTRASVDGYLGSRYTLSVTNSGGGYASVAGMEIANTSSGGKQTTNHIAFFADRFYISHGSSSASAAPFEVVGGQVYIKSAVIQDASITNAKIGTAEVSTLKIAGNAVTIPGAATGTYSATVSLSTDISTSFAVIATFTQGDLKPRHRWSIYVNGNPYTTEQPINGTTGAMTIIANLPPGEHTFSIDCAQKTGDGRCGITVIGVKR